MHDVPQIAAQNISPNALWIRGAICAMNAEYTQGDAGCAGAALGWRVAAPAFAGAMRRRGILAKQQ